MSIDQNPAQPRAIQLGPQRQDLLSAATEQLLPSVSAQPQIYVCPVPHCPHLIRMPDDGVIVAWLDAKTNKSKSWKTHVAYHTAVLSFRDRLRQHGLDLFLNLEERATRARFLLLVQQWAGERAPGSRRQGELANNTYNHRLAALSSLYTYARRMQLITTENPIDAIERRDRPDTIGPRAIETFDMRQLLAKIDRSIPIGMRDYALIAVALNTGSRGQALADLRIEHLSWRGKQLLVFFPKMKRNKQREKLLDIETSVVLTRYLIQIYGIDWQRYRTAPVWISLSNNAPRNQPLSIQAIGQIYSRRLGTSKSHVTRHTAARTLIELGASVNDVKEFLDHENIATTDTYLRRLKPVENKYGRDLEQVYGIRANHDPDVG